MGLSASIYLYLLEIVGFFLIATLAIVQSRNRIHVAFLIFASALGIWQLLQASSLIAANASLPGVATYLLMTSVLFSVVMATSVLIFSRAYSNRRWRLGLLIPAVLVGSLAYLSPELEAVPITSHAVGIPKLDPYYASILIYNVFLLILAIVTLVKFYHATRSKQQKAQTRIILGGFSVAGTVVILGSFYTSDFSDSAIAQLILPTTCLITLMVFLYAIRKTGLFDIRLAAVRTVAYGLSLISLSVIYYFLAYLVSTILFRGDTVSGLSLSPINIMLALVLAFLFQPIRRFFDQATDKVFFHDRYKPDDFYARLSEVLTTTTDLRTLLHRAAEEIGDTLKAQQVFFYIKHGEKHHLTVGTSRHTTLPAGDIKLLDEYSQQVDRKEVIVADMLDDKHRMIKKILISHRIEILMPLFRDRTILGYVALGPQQSAGYVKRDVKALETVSDELVIAIQNALSVQEVKELNAHLQQRISAATSELRRTNARLRRLDTTKDEFLSMASHQLRTPLTSIKGYLSMVLDGDLGRVSATQKRVLEEAFTSSERMVHLIHDFLNVSRLQTGRFVLELGEADLSNLVKDEIDSLRRVAESRNMKLEYDDQAGAVPLLIDDTKIRQVVMNYIDNAIYYSKPDTTINVELLRQNGDVVLKVHDTGIGVPASEQVQLFEKFFRATNARKQRPDGTGVGLYLAKKVITAHGGDVLFNSKSNNGSTFGFRLPLKQDHTLLEKNGTKQL